MKKYFIVLFIGVLVTGAAVTVFFLWRGPEVTPPVTPPVPTPVPPSPPEPVTMRYELPAVLREISGITPYGEGQLACVQDESGQIYVFDLATEALTTLPWLPEPGDFEDIVYQDARFYLLRSDGLLVQIDPKDGTVERFGLQTGAKDNEGLAFDPVTGLLLVCTKSKDTQRKQDKHRRFVFGFDPRTRQQQEIPVLTIDIVAVVKWALAHQIPLVHRNFRPSGLAVDPATGHFLVLSGKDHLLAAFDRAGAVVSVWALDEARHPKAEGLCFDSGGRLYVSNEGGDGSGTIVLEQLASQ